MLQQSKIDFIVGLFVIAGILAMSFLALRVSGLTPFNNQEIYRVQAYFTNIGDLKIRAPVSIGGVTIGRVVKVDLDPETFNAVVTMEINKQQDHIPTDSIANIYTAGLIGTNYINLAPGFDETYLKEGSQIRNTNQALILQNIIGQLMFNVGQGKKSDTK